MRKLITTCVAFVMLLFFTACDPAQSVVRELESLATDLEANSHYYDASDWEDAALSFQEIVEELEQYDYTDEELVEIGRLKGVCAAYFTKQAVKNYQSELEDLAKELEGGIKGFLEVFEDDDEASDL